MSCRPCVSVAMAIWFTALLFAPDASAHSSFRTDSGDSRRYPEHSRAQENPWLSAVRVPDGAVKLDGKLDDEVWGDASSGWGFLEMDPDRGRTASEETVFRVAYDDEAIYFGVACFERDTSNTSSVALPARPAEQQRHGLGLRRPLPRLHDRLQLPREPRGRSGGLLRLQRRQPRQGLERRVVGRDSPATTEGWYAEIRVPFSAMRYRPQESMTWGLQVYRYMHGRGEDTGWASWERNASGFVSRFGELRDLRDVPAPRAARDPALHRGARPPTPRSPGPKTSVRTSATSART